MNPKHKKYEKPRHVIKLHQDMKCIGINLIKYVQNSDMEN